jgi:hypothetical protein
MASYIYLPVPTPGMQSIAVALQSRINSQHPGTCRAPRRNLVSRGRWKGIFRSLGCSGCLTGIGAADVLYICIHGTGRLAMEVVSAERNVAREVYDDLPDGAKPVPNHLRPLDAQPVAAAGPVSDLKTYSAHELAAVIEKEGLSKAHQRIELLACGAGFEDNAEQRFYEKDTVARDIKGKFREDKRSAEGDAKRVIKEKINVRIGEVRSLVNLRHQRMEEYVALKRSFGERFFDALRARGYVGITVNAYRGDVHAGTSVALAGRDAAPFAVKANGTTQHPDAAGLRVSYPLPLD